jgi:hypothetical protein
MLLFIDNADKIVSQLCKYKLNQDISKIILDFWCVDMHTMKGLKLLTLQPNRRRFLSNIKQLDLYCAEMDPYQFIGISGEGSFHVGIDSIDSDELQIQFMCCKKCGSYNMHYISIESRGNARIFCNCL